MREYAKQWATLELVSSDQPAKQLLIWSKKYPKNPTKNYLETSIIKSVDYCIYLLVEPTHLKNMLESNWIFSPIFGLKMKKYLSCHHLGIYVSNLFFSSVVPRFWVQPFEGGGRPICWSFGAGMSLTFRHSFLTPGPKQGTFLFFFFRGNPSKLP